MAAVPKSRSLMVDEIKQIAREKGWTNRALAARWDRSETWISKILNDPDRHQQWDDAVMGLPLYSSAKDGVPPDKTTA